MTNQASPNRLSRTEKTSIARKLHENLSQRAQQGPAEPGLDAFIPMLDTVATRLETHVSGKIGAIAARVAYADQTERADDEVDRWGRHIQVFLDIEGLRRHGPFAAAVRVLSAAAFPEGLSFVEERIPEENAKMRAALAILRAPEHEGTLAGIGFPLGWLDLLEKAVMASDEAFANRVAARGEGGMHVELGKDAEAEWLDVVVRLRRYVESRAAASDVKRQVENRALMAPLMDALAHAQMLIATRATRRAKEGEAEGPASTTE